jgi:hypothetical protein
MHEIKNTVDLRKMLLETIAAVKSGEMDCKTARTVSALSTTILQSAKLDLDYLRFNSLQESSEKSTPRALPLVDGATS